MNKVEPNTFWGHMEELAKRLKVVLFTFIVSTLVILFLPANMNFLQNINNYQPLVSIFLRSIRERVLAPEIKLIAIQFTDPIELYVWAAVIFSTAITMPVLAYEVYKFVDPALHEHEKKEIYPFATAATVLFSTGAAFGFFILFPFFIVSMFPFFTAVGAELMFSIMDFYNILFFTVLSTGVVFTIPVFFVLLVKYGIIKTDVFRKHRKYLYLGLLILAMFISPGASPQGNVFLFLPLILLLESSLFVGRRYEKQGKVHPISIFSSPKCKFCREDLTTNSIFCSKCGQSQS
jgi:sec-independent protein translocase protein TatC